MKLTKSLIALSLASLFSLSAMAHGGGSHGASSHAASTSNTTSESSATTTSASPATAKSVVARDERQEQRIENGLQSGELTVKEAAKLESEEARIDRQEARDLKNGPLTASEAATLTAEQNRVSANIYKAKHNAVIGNPHSISSLNMQADVQRNINQQARIEQGLQSGQLTNQETARLERGQARIDRHEARAGADGQISALEQYRIQRQENRQSRRIYDDKHNAVVSTTSTTVTPTTTSN